MYTILLLSLTLFISAPAAVWAVTNPGYRSLSVPEQPAFDIRAFGIRINTLSGNLPIQVSLFRVPGKGIPPDFFLTYNSDHRAIRIEQSISVVVPPLPLGEVGLSGPGEGSGGTLRR